MSPEIHAIWKEILDGRNVGDTVLEIGAVPTTDSLLEIFGACILLPVWKGLELSEKGVAV